jgi:hypothetical protein
MFPPDSTDPGVVDPVRSLGQLRLRQGKRAEARVALARALSITVKLDPTSVDTARARIELAQIDHDPVAFEAGLAQLIQQLGKDHPEVAKVRERGARIFGPTKPDPR